MRVSYMHIITNKFSMLTDNITRQILGARQLRNVQFLRTLNMNGIVARKASDEGKREAEDTAEIPNKKLCVEEKNVATQEKQSTKKHKFAMLMGYSGKNYCGMQFNGNANTIEYEIFKAFYEVGIIKEKEEPKPYTIKFERASRTDREVSAATQVVSFLMAKNACSPEDLNAHLPPDIRIFSIKRVTKGFDSKDKCDARSYSYVLPTQVFSKEPLEKFSELDYRITPDLIEKINEVLNAFVGTHNFHNFTSKRHFEDPAANRYIISFQCGEPFVMGKEFILLSVKGQSFILHQIRKMVGATVGVLRGHITVDMIKRSFLSEKIRMPLIPGTGLFLERPHFDKYNKRYGNDGFHETLTWDDVEEEILKFRQKLISNIVEEELTNKAIIKWAMEKLDNYKYYFTSSADQNTAGNTTANEVEEENAEESEAKA